MSLRAWCLGEKKSILEYVKFCYNCFIFASMFTKSIIKNLEPFHIKNQWCGEFRRTALYSYSEGKISVELYPFCKDLLDFQRQGKGLVDFLSLTLKNKFLPFIPSETVLPVQAPNCPTSGWILVQFVNFLLSCLFSVIHSFIKHKLSS